MNMIAVKDKLPFTKHNRKKFALIADISTL